MEKKPKYRVRTIGLAALAALVALVAAVSSSSADSTASTAAPAAVTQAVDSVPVQETTPEAPSPGDRHRDCPKDGGDGAASGDAASEAPSAPSTEAPAPAL